MHLLDAIRLRHTTNSKFSERPIQPEHLRLILESAAHAFVVPGQPIPWRIVLITEPERRAVVAELAGKSMKEQMEGPFFQRYKKYFRFSAAESESRRDGILIDRMPAILRPFIRLVFSPGSGRLMGMFGASRILGRNQQDIVLASPVILAVALDKTLYQPHEDQGLYAATALGAIVQTFWLTTTSLDMGMQFISLPLEVPERKALIAEMLRVPAQFDLVALFRIGYRDTAIARNSIDWVSNQRRSFADLTGFNGWDSPAPPEVADAQSILWTPPEA